jgi:predicted choloylglycine hydrolase
VKKHTRLLLVMIMLVLAVACSPKQSAPETPKAQPAAVQPASAPVAEQPKPAEPPKVEAPAPAAAKEEVWRVPEIVNTPEIKVLAQEGPGKLLQVGRELLCVMEGTPEEMGFQHGKMLAEKVHHIIKDGYMAKAIYGQRGYTADVVTRQCARMEKFFPPEYIAEMQGIVKGLQAAGINDITYEDIRTGACAAELLHKKPEDPVSGCTNFAVWGKWTSDGRLLHGRNLDWPIELGAQDDAVNFVWRPKGGIPFMMVGFAGCIGSISGFNAKGITIGEMTSTSTDETFDGLPVELHMRLVIEKATNIEEAIAVLRDTPRTLGWNMLIGDGNASTARALEIDAKDCEVFGPNDPNENQSTGHWAMEDCVRRTNHPCGMTKIKKMIAVYGKEYGITEENLAAAIPLLQLQDTWIRYDWLGNMIKEREGKIDIQQGLELLANGQVYGTDTLHSWVFDPKNNVAFVSQATSNPEKTAQDNPYTRLDLAEYFK